jgi:RNA polymerase sigma-70 factor (ECF subfamily)
MEILSKRVETPSRQAVRIETEQAVRVSVAALPEDQRAAVNLHHLEGKSIAETAQSMHRSPGAIRGLLRRARQSLRQLLTPRPEGSCKFK